MTGSLLCLSLLICVVVGGDLYVEEGAVNGTCSMVDPCSSLDEALAQSIEGDVIHLGAGDFSTSGSTTDGRSFVGSGVDDTTITVVNGLFLSRDRFVRDMTILKQDGTIIFAEPGSSMEHLFLQVDFAGADCILGPDTYPRVDGTWTVTGVETSRCGMRFVSTSGPGHRQDVVIENSVIFGGYLDLQGDGIHAQVSDVAFTGSSSGCVRSRCSEVTFTDISLGQCTSSGDGGAFSLSEPYQEVRRGVSVFSYHTDITFAGDIVIENSSANRGGAISISYNAFPPTPGVYMTIDTTAAEFSLSDNSASSGGNDLSISINDDQAGFSPEQVLALVNLENFVFPVDPAAVDVSPEALSSALCDAEKCVCFNSQCRTVGSCDVEAELEDGTSCPTDTECHVGECEEGVCVDVQVLSYACASSTWNAIGGGVASLALVGVIGAAFLAHRRKLEVIANMSEKEKAQLEAQKAEDEARRATALLARGPPGLFSCFSAGTGPIIVFLLSYVGFPAAIVMSWIRARGDIVITFFNSLFTPCLCFCYPCWYRDATESFGMDRPGLGYSCLATCCCAPCAVSQLFALRQYHLVVKATASSEATAAVGMEMPEMTAVVPSQKPLMDTNEESV